MSSGFCILTMVKDEFHFLPIWLKYYRRHFADADIFLLDNKSGPEFRELIPSSVNRITVPDHLSGTVGGPKTVYRRVSFDSARASFVSHLGNGLLNYYKGVIYVDVDEFLIPSAEFGHCLSRFLASGKIGQVTAALGVNVTQLPALEPAALDPARPILEQRAFCYLSDRYSKPLVRTGPAMWGTGFHGCNKPFTIDDDLFLFHMRDSDLDTRRNSHVMRHKEFQDHGKGAGATWQKDASWVLDTHLGRLERSRVSQATFDTVDHGYRVREVREGFHRVLCADGTLSRQSQFDIYRIPPSFASLV